MNFVVESDRLHIRPFKLSDVEAYHQMTQDPLIQHFVSFACSSSLEEAFEAFEYCYSAEDNPYDFYLILEDKKSKQIVGAIISTAISTSPHILDVCILTDAAQRRKGYMFEALSAFIDALPKSTELLFAIKRENFASIKTVTKLPGVVEKPFTEHPAFIQFSITT